MGMIITHDTARQNDGRLIKITRVKYQDEQGTPMAASLHGWLHEQTVNNMLLLYRRDDMNQIKWENPRPNG